MDLELPLMTSRSERENISGNGRMRVNGEAN